MGRPGPKRRTLEDMTAEGNNPSRDTHRDDTFTHSDHSDWEPLPAIEDRPLDASWTAWEQPDYLHASSPGLSDPAPVAVPAPAYASPNRPTGARPRRKIVARALAHQGGPCIVDVEVEKEDDVFPMVPAGKPLEDMLIEPPKHKVERPTGST